MAYCFPVKKIPRSLHIFWIGLAVVIIHLYFADIQHEEPLKMNEYKRQVQGFSVYAIQFLKNKYLHPPSSKHYNITNADGQYNQGDRKFSGAVRASINSIFKNIKNGFFIEAGALDGVYLSNTLELEQVNNWSGLLIEPNPVSYKLLQQKNRKAWTSNTCISDGNYTKETVFVALSGETDMFLMNVRGASYELGNDILNSSRVLADKHYVTVQCFPLITYILALNAKTVDLLSLDIQGREQEVLATLPYDMINFRLIAVENTLDRLDTQMIKDMKLRGFRYFFNDCENYIFLKEGDVKLDSVELDYQVFCNYTTGMGYLKWKHDTNI